MSFSETLLPAPAAAAGDRLTPGRRAHRLRWRGTAASTAAACALTVTRGVEDERQAARRHRGDRLQQLARHARFRSEHDHPFDQVLQLTHVAGPVVVQELVRQLRADRRHRLVVLHGVLPQEVLGEDRNLLPPLAQRRQADRDDVQAEVQVLAELSRRDRRFEVAVGRGDQPHIDLDVRLAAEPRELAVLQHLQQLGLQRIADVADLVEEHRPVVGELELARASAGWRR